MPTAYTSLLGLALPVTGELSGTWGDTVNDYITKYLDSSVAGTQTISGSQTAVTLTRANGGALSPVGSGSTGSSQYQIINCTGNPAGTLTITVDVSTGTYALSNSTYSQTFAVINATSTSQSVVVRATTTTGTSTGVTLVAGEKAVIAWNGSDFIKVATSAVDGVSTISFGTTGLTPSTATSGAVTVAGTLVAANGGTGQSSYTTGDLLYATGSTALSKLGIGTNGQVLTSTGTAPQWSTLSGVAVTTFSAGTTGFTPSTATSGAVTLAGTLATTNGGTGLTSFTANGVVYASSTSALTTGSALTFDGATLTTKSVFFATDSQSYFGDNGVIGGGAADGNTTIRYFGGKYLAFKEGTSEQMRLTSTGLGIGTSSPSTKLHVTGSVANGAVTYLNNTDTANGNGLFIRAGGSNAGKYALAVENAAASSLLVLEASGNVGIGTSSPTQKLTVNGNIETQNAGYVRSVGTGSDTAGVGPNIGVNSSAAIYYIQQLNASNGLDFWYYNAGWNKRLTLDSSGNLGLGVTPSAWNSAYTAFDIKRGSVFQNSASNWVGLANNAYNNGTNWIYKESTVPRIFRIQNDQFEWLTAPSGTAGNAISFTQAMTLDASGNLLVGTTSSTPANANGLIAYGGTDAGIVYLQRTTGTDQLRFYVGGNRLGYLNTASSAVTLGTANFPLVFATNDTERFRIASNGAWGLAGANYGTSGQVLTSNGSGSAPTWQNAGGGGGSAATPTALGTVYGSMTTAGASPYLTAVGYNAGTSNTSGAYNFFGGYLAGNGVSTGSYTTALGSLAGNSPITGNYNTAVGYYAYGSGSSGANNTAVGAQALYLNTTASNNTAVGYQSLYSATTSPQNVAVGYQALLNTTTGNGGNTALGHQALLTNSTGDFNVAVGISTMRLNTTGGSNSALGTTALFYNTTGSQNVAVGESALQSNTTGSVNTAVGYQALFSNTTASYATAVGYQALYTNNAFYPTAVGYQAARSNTSGDIVAFGYQAAYSHTSGVNNTALGNSALYSNTGGTQNTAVGAAALLSVVTGSANTAMGRGALQNNLTDNNTAIGYYAMQATTTGTENSAYGRDALVSNTTGPQNVAIGNGALAVNTVSGYNTAVGHRAGYSTNTNGANTLIGYQAGYYITTGTQNTLIGYFNGNYVVQLTTGSFNIHLGTYLYSSSATVSNEIVVGYNVSGRGANTAFIGASSGAYQQNNSSSWSTTSDFRLKKNIVDNNEGLEKIAAIRVRNFEYRTEEEVTDFPAHMVVKKEGVQLGVIAQELQQVCPDCVKEESTGVLSVDSDNVFWHMVNAIKQLKTELDTVKAELATLKGA